MGRRINKSLAVFLGIILAISGNITISGLAKAKKPDKKTNNSLESKKPVKILSFNERREELYKNPDWLKLSQIWKDTNHMEFDKDTQEGYEQKSLQLDKNLEDFEQKINTLKNSGLLTDEEASFLSTIYNERAKNILPLPVGVTCYLMGKPDSKSSRTVENLENNLDKLEQLLKDGKINTETYNTAVKVISNYLYRLYPEGAEKPVTNEPSNEESTLTPVLRNEMKKDLLDLIININK